MSIPPPLLQAVERQEWVPFLGPAPDPGLLTSADLARTLAADLSSPPPNGLPQVAQAYALAFGTAALRRRLLELWRDSDFKPTAVHHLLTRLPLRLVLTTAQHTLLEDALRQARRTVNIIITQDDLSYYDEGAVNVVKLWGDVTRPDTLVLTEKEHLTLFDTSPLLADVIRAALATRTLLFLGLNLDDPALRQLIFQVTRLQGRHKRRAYAFWPPTEPGPTDTTRRYWEEEQVIILDQTPARFLFDIDRALAARPRPGVSVPERPGAPAPRPQPPLPRRPYRFLDPYTAADAPLFFGREREARLLAQKILAHRLVVLTGPLGVGKTSLVQAGVGPLLENQGWRLVPVRLLTDLRQAVHRALTATLDIALPAGLPLGDLLARAEAQVEDRLVLVLDPFEDLFTRGGPEAQRAATEALADMLAHPDVDARLLLVVRGDYLMHLAALERPETGITGLPEMMHNVFPLNPFSPDQAVVALTGPLRALNLNMEEGLAQRVARDLKDVEGHVLPSQLQIVADRLYDDLIARGGTTITREDYERLGGAEELLRQYLGDLLERIPHARAVLETLVGEGGTRVAREVPTIARDTSLSPDTVEATLDALHEGRVVVPLAVEDRRLWELSHDILAQTLWEWLGDEARERARALAVLERAWADWTASAALPEPRRLDFIAARWTFLPALSPGHQALLLRAAITHAHRVDEWLRRVCDDDARRDVLLALAEEERPAVRARALTLLATHLPAVALPVLADHTLNDPARSVRRAAVLAWHDLAPDEAWNTLHTTRHGDSTRARFCIEALADLWDADRVDTLAGLGAGVAILLEFVHLRLDADSPRWQRRVLAAALGGGLGMGLGTSLAAVLQGQLFIAAIIFPLGAVFGLVAGLGEGLGFAWGEALRLGHARRARTVGGALWGGFSTGLAGGAAQWFVTPRGQWFPMWLGGWFLIGVGIGIGLGVSDSRWGRLTGAALGGLIGGVLAMLVGLFVWPVGLLTGLFVALALIVADDLGM